MQKQPINKTLIGDQFDNVFTEITHSETLGLLNPNELRIFCLDIASNVFSFDALQEFLLDNIGSYVLSRATIDKLINGGRNRSIDLTALRSMNKQGLPDTKGTGNELGEMLIYAFLEQVLNAPKLLSKIELASSGNQSKCDCVHLLTCSDNKGPYHQMVFGTSSIIGDIKDAIDTAFDALSEIKASQTTELQLVEKNIFGQCFDADTEELIKAIILPQKNTNSTVEPAFGMFLGYSIGLDKNKYPSRQFYDEVEKTMREDIAAHIDYIINKIHSLGLNTHSFYIYVLPFNDAETEKKAIMANLMSGGATI